MRFHRLISALVGMLAVVMLAPAQAAWPERPIKVIEPFPAGGQLDVVVRLMAEKISPALGVPIVVEVHTGADGNIGAELAARSAPDGYTWFATSVPFTTQAALQPGKLRYDPLRDFMPVANLGTASFVLVVPNSVPVSTLKEFIAYAKARPGELSYAGTSVGSVTHLSTEMFARAVGIRMEMIPYAGIPAAMSDLLAGRTQFMSTGVVAALPQIKAGKLKPLAILAPAVRPAGAGENAGGSRAADQRRDHEGDARPRRAREISDDGRRPGRAASTGSVRKLVAKRDRPMGEGDSRRPRQGAVKTLSPGGPTIRSARMPATRSATT